MSQYTTSAGAARLGVARQTVRAYAARYARFLSTEGAPAERGQARRFTEADLKTLAYVRHHTELGATHDDVIEQLTSGALDKWDWSEARLSAVHDDQDSAYDDIGGHSALIPAERFLAAQALLQDAQTRLVAEEAKNEALQAEMRALERALGKADSTQILYEDARRREQEAKEHAEQLQRELAALKASKPKGFWARLLGGGE